jgi:hypothetical protein
MSSVYRSQRQIVLHHLKDTGPLDALTALRLYGVQRLAPRIFELREEGWLIVSETVRGGGKRWSRYWLVSTTRNSGKGLFPQEGGGL